MTTRIVIQTFLFLVTAASAGGAETAEVRLRSTVICEASIVRLGDVAEIHADDPALAASLSDIALLPAPTAGAARQLSQHQVRQLLAVSGVEMNGIAVTGSEAVLLQTESAALPARPKRKSPSIWHVQQASLEREESAKDMRLVRPASTAETAQTPQKPQPLPRLVERGTEVTVCSRGAGVQVTTSGKALGHGTLGETVAIELADTRDRILARVVGPRAVEVGAAAAGGSVKAVSGAPATIAQP
jgi:hypothetical protein